MKRAWVWIVGLLVLYAATRLFNLTKLPIFTDEAIYIRWSQIGAQDANWRFISLTDGKQPMFTWVVMILLRLVKGDPLFVGRLASVMAGVGSMIGMWLLSRELFKNKTAANLVAFIYIISPFTLWYDRMALYDSMVFMFSVWNLWLAVKLVRAPRLDTALILGMLLGMGMLNKSSGFLSFYLLPFTLILFDWQNKKKWIALRKWLLLVVLAAVLSQIIYSILRLSPFFYIVGQKNNVFLFSPSEWLNQPFRFLEGNLRGMFDWIIHYMTFPIFYISLTAIFFRDNMKKERILLYLWFLLPFVALANFAKVLYPRFILFMSIPLYVLAADAVVHFFTLTKRPLLNSIFVLVLFLPGSMISYKIIIDPLHAPIPRSDRFQYIEDWPSGWGVPQVVSYLKTHAIQQKITVFTEGTFGLFPYALEIYLVDNPNIKIHGIWPLPEMFPDEILQASLVNPTYFIMNETQGAPKGWPLQLVGVYKKGTVDKYMRLYKVAPTIAFEYD